MHGLTLLPFFIPQAGGDTVCHSVVFPFELVRELADVLEKPGGCGSKMQ